MAKRKIYAFDITEIGNILVNLIQNKNAVKALIRHNDDSLIDDGLNVQKLDMAFEKNQIQVTVEHDSFEDVSVYPIVPMKLAVETLSDNSTGVQVE
jgi:hypothetical protein